LVRMHRRHVGKVETVLVIAALLTMPPAGSFTHA